VVLEQHRAAAPAAGRQHYVCWLHRGQARFHKYAEYKDRKRVADPV